MIVINSLHKGNISMKKESFLITTVVVIFVSLFAVVDSIDTIDFTVEAAWITLFSTLLVTVIVSYFGSRGVEKYQKIKK